MNDGSGRDERLGMRLGCVGQATVALICVLALMIIIKYARRPMFAGSFELGDPGLPWPRWTSKAWYDKRQLVLIDDSLNTVAYIIASEDPARRYAFLWDPTTVGDHAVLPYLLVDDGHNGPKKQYSLVIPKKRNRLFMFLPDETSQECELKAGDVVTIERDVRTLLQKGLRADFRQRCALSGKEAEIKGAKKNGSGALSPTK